MAPTDTQSSAAPTGSSALDQAIERALGDYTARVRDDRPYEDTVAPDELRHRYDKK